MHTATAPEQEVADDRGEPVRLLQGDQVAGAVDDRQRSPPGAFGDHGQCRPGAAGFAPSIVASWLARQVAWQTAAPWLLTAMPVPAEIALRHGLVRETAADPDARAREYVTTLTGLDDYSLRECKRFGRMAEDVPREAWVSVAVDSLVRQPVQAAENKK